MLSITQERVFRQRSYTSTALTTACNSKLLISFNGARRDLGVPSPFTTYVEIIQGLRMNGDQVKRDEDARKEVDVPEEVQQEIERPKERAP